MSTKVLWTNKVKYGWVAAVKHEYYFQYIRKLFSLQTGYVIVYYSPDKKKWYELESYIHLDKKTSKLLWKITSGLTEDVQTDSQITKKILDRVLWWRR